MEIKSSSSANISAPTPSLEQQVQRTLKIVAAHMLKAMYDRRVRAHLHAFSHARAYVCSACAHIVRVHGHALTGMHG